MSTVQSLTAIVALIFALSVVVQIIQEFVKALLQTKADAMKTAVEKFMGASLTVPQVKKALGDRGLDLTALEDLRPEEFRHLLNAIPFEAKQLQGVLAKADAQADEVKDSIAASYNAALALFQEIYTKRNKLIALVLSVVVVILLNANIIILYENVSADPAAQQAILDKVKSVDAGQQKADPSCKEDDITCAYQKSRNDIATVLKKEPILIRTSKYAEDYGDGKYARLFGLLIMAGLVSLGAPFWNDVLKSATGVNNALNGNAKRT